MVTTSPLRQPMKGMKPSISYFHNVVFIVFIQVVLTGEATSSFGEVEASSFITYEFFEHEIQATPVMKGNRYCIPRCYTEIIK